MTSKSKSESKSKSKSESKKISLCEIPQKFDIWAIGHSVATGEFDKLTRAFGEWHKDRQVWEGQIDDPDSQESLEKKKEFHKRKDAILDLLDKIISPQHKEKEPKVLMDKVDLVSLLSE